MELFTLSSFSQKLTLNLYVSSHQVQGVSAKTTTKVREGITSCQSATRGLLHQCLANESSKAGREKNIYILITIKEEP